MMQEMEEVQSSDPYRAPIPVSPWGLQLRCEGRCRRVLCPFGGVILNANTEKIRNMTDIFESCGFRCKGCGGFVGFKFDRYE